MMNRCVSEIIDKILACIPIMEAELRDEILTYKNSLWNKALELLRTSECWTPLQITPLKIYNGTPDGRLNRDLRATLPINQLKGKPPVAVCPILHLFLFKTHILYISHTKHIFMFIRTTCSK